MIFKRALLKAGVFHFTFLPAFFLACYFTPDPPRTVRPRVATQKPLAPRVFNIIKDVRPEAEMVIMDRAHGRSYTRLRLVFHGAWPAPERLRARTYFFLPGDPAQRVWTGQSVEINRPFEESHDTTVTVADVCDLCDDRDAPRGGYFARVQLYADGVETPLPVGERFFDAATAAPVLINVEPGRAP